MSTAGWTVTAAGALELRRVDDAETIEAVASRLLRTAGLRYSSRRRTVVEILAAALHPMTAGELAEAGRLPESSTYRVLDELGTAGVINAISTAPTSSQRFELSEAVTNRHHHHAICSTCNQVFDYEADGDLEAAIALFVRTFAKRTGFAVASHDLDLRGRCGPCRSDQAPDG